MEAPERHPPPGVPPAAPGAWRPEDLGFVGDVHPIDVLDDVVCLVGSTLADVRAARALEHMASVPWLSIEAVRALESRGERANLRARLGDAGIAVTGLDAVAYGELDARPVKEGRFLPDWSDERRRRYTLAAAEVLADFLSPDAVEGTLTSVPLGWRASWSGEKENRSAGQLLEVVRGLDALAARTGRLVRLCLRPEPGAVLERSEQTAAFYRGWLLPAADALGIGRDLVRRHLGICFDACHQAVMHEDMASALARLLADQVPIGKIRLACALEAPDARSKTALAACAEPRYLHQVRLRLDGYLDGTPDLDQAFARIDLPHERPWRARFHVPLHRPALGRGLRATQAEVLALLDFIARHAGFRPQLEVAVDTWHVLEEGERPAGDDGLAAAIAGQLAWVEAQLQRRALLL